MRTIFTPCRQKKEAARKADDAHNAAALEKLYNYLTQKESYKSICRKLGLPARRLEAYIFQELGYRGEELVQTLKKLE